MLRASVQSRRALRWQKDEITLTYRGACVAYVRFRMLTSRLRDSWRFRCSVRISCAWASRLVCFTEAAADALQNLHRRLLGLRVCRFSQRCNWWFHSPGIWRRVAGWADPTVSDDKSTSGFRGVDYTTVEHEGDTNGNHGEAAVGTWELMSSAAFVWVPKDCAVAVTELRRFSRSGLVKFPTVQHHTRMQFVTFCLMQAQRYGLHSDSFILL